MKTLIIADHDNTTLKSATLNVVSAAREIGNDIDVLVVGYHCESVADQAASLKGINQVWLSDHESYEHQFAENISQLIVSISSKYSHILMVSNSKGKDILPRAAALLDVNPISDVIGIVSIDTFKRPIYAGNAVATVQCLDSIKVMSIRSTAFEPIIIDDEVHCSVEKFDEIIIERKTQFLNAETSLSERPELTSAKIVVSGGRGVGSSQGFNVIYDLADRLNAGVGASRAAVDAGYVPNDMQVGQTGKVVAPEIYFAIGMSGAIQHLAGMKDSKIIVAINTDEEAPIFQVADYGLVADLFEVVPELTAKLSV